MTIVVGCHPREGNAGVVRLAGLLARSLGDQLVVCAVTPTPWPPRPGAVDAPYRDSLQNAAEQALLQARSRLDADVEAEFVVRQARSAPAGLCELAGELSAALIVVGSSRWGAVGQVVPGTVTDRLLHSAGVAVVVAPRGFRCRAATGLTRVTAAFPGSAGSVQLVAAAGELAARAGATLRIACFAVRPVAAFAGAIDVDAERLVVEQWLKAIDADLNAAIDEVRGLAALSQTVIAQGGSWREALDDVEWADGDLLAVGSSPSGPLAQVFVGSNASKIIRRAPVPVVVMPRGAPSPR